MVICLPYDLLNIYAFFCARYGNMTYQELLNMGYEEFSAKLNSIPKDEPLYEIIKSRAIKLESIKDKEYKSNDMVLSEIKTKLNGKRGLL